MLRYPGLCHAMLCEQVLFNAAEELVRAIDPVGMSECFLPVEGEATDPAQNWQRAFARVEQNIDHIASPHRIACRTLHLGYN